ncbi:MAG: histidine kinase [Dialister sp.]|nr:histidine kinase [Dialister sp.]
MAEEKRVNLKADKFEKYLNDRDMKFFEKSAARDETETVLFRSNLNIDNQKLPVVVITDNTIYTIIRVQVGTGLVSVDNKERMSEYLNEMNRSYKVFKYVYAEDGTIFLDCCLPSTNESFDPEVVRVVLDVVVDHLNTEFKVLMKKVWG